MKVKYIFLIVSLLTIFACDKDSEDVSRVTFFPEITLKGDNPMFSALGKEFVDPGAIATEQGNEIPVKASHAINTNIIGGYTVNYTAINIDGFSKTDNRIVFVGKAPVSTHNLVGNYKAEVTRATYPAGAASGAYSDLGVKITRLNDFSFHISDWIGGFYDQGRGNGPSYAFDGVFSVDADGNILWILNNDPFGFGFASLEGTFDVNTNVMKYSIVWNAGYKFNVKLSLK